MENLPFFFHYKLSHSCEVNHVYKNSLQATSVTLPEISAPILEMLFERDVTTTLVILYNKQKIYIYI